MVLTEKICSLSRYAGLVIKYRYLEYSIIIIQVLIAQIIWYFIEGFHRSNEPFGSRENYIKYIVPMKKRLFFIKATKRTGGGLRFHLFQMVIN
jgi:hypothetical protein